MATKDDTTRKNRLRELSKLYKRVEGMNSYQCAYCGEGRELMDVIPPLPIAENMDTADFLMQGGEFIIVPCCTHCSALLYGSGILDYEGRLTRLLGIYQEYNDRRHLEGSSASIWSDDEIATMGCSLKVIAANSEANARFSAKKLLGVSQRILALPNPL